MMSLRTVYSMSAPCGERRARSSRRRSWPETVLGSSSRKPIDIRYSLRISWRAVRRPGQRVPRAQRGAVVPALVGQDGPPVAAQLFVCVLELLPGAPLPPELAEVLGVPLVGAAPGLRHLLHRGSRIGPSGQRYPGRDLPADLAARRAVLPLPVGDRGHLLE